LYNGSVTVSARGSSEITDGSAPAGFPDVPDDDACVTALLIPNPTTATGTANSESNGSFISTRSNQNV
jgi:hypothetical protein